MTWSDDDQQMADLRNWLVEQGFVVLTDHYYPDHFGNQVVEMARPVGVRLVRDRDEWGIDLVGPDGNWLPLALWLDPTAGSRRERLSAADQGQLLRAHLTEIEKQASGGGRPTPTD